MPGEEQRDARGRRTTGLASGPRLAAGRLLAGILPPGDRRALVLVACVAASAAVAQPPFAAPPWLAAMAAGLWVCASWYALGLRSVGAALPALALATTGWAWWLGWTAAGIAMTLAAGAAARQQDPRRVQLAAHLDRFPVLLDACLDLSSARDEESFAGALCAHARRLVVEAAAVRVHLGRGDALRLAACAGASAPSGPEERFVARESRPLVLRDGLSSALLLPLRGDRRQGDDAEATRGCLTIVLPADAPFDPLRREAVEALARLGGLGLAAVELVERTRAAAMKDDLTGLFGRDEFRRRLDEQIAEARRRQRPLALIAADLDHLKRINDRHGHAVGDRAILAAAEAIAAALPSRGLACRMGGEEFAVLLPATGRAEAAALAERIRAAVAAAALPGGLRISASFGVAELAADGSAGGLLAAADAALYAAKSAGRDRVAEAAP